MQQTVPSAALLGLDVYRVRVEVAITRGAPLIQVVGLPASAVREGRERIRAAAAGLGLHVPGLRITVNLAPAGVRKGGAAFDLPILVGILAAAGQVPAESCRRWAMVGELGLDGSLRPVRGALPIALHAREAGDVDGLLLPLANLREVRPVPETRDGDRGFSVLGASGLAPLVAFLRGEASLTAPGDLDDPEDGRPGRGDGGPDLADVCGQKVPKIALEIAAAGGHNLLFRGAPGAGKTMLARRLPGLLPSMSLPESLEVTAVHSVAGRLPPDAGRVRVRPFRAPHHTVTRAGLVGGGAVPRPGEASLAHRGVLFLDELPEFRGTVLDALRQPLEEGVVSLVRARASVTYPAGFTLVAAMNPCPCGYRNEGGDRCTCDDGVVSTYRGRVSGPLLDRIDLHVDVRGVRWGELRRGRGDRTSAEVRDRVREARRRAARRLGPPAGAASGPRPGLPGGQAAGPRCNAGMTVAEIREHCQLEAGGEAALEEAVDARGLTARGCHRVLRVARTVADLQGSHALEGRHVLRALSFRAPDDPRAPGGG